MAIAITETSTATPVNKIRLIVVSSWSRSCGLLPQFPDLYFVPEEFSFRSASYLEHPHKFRRLYCRLFPISCFAAGHFEEHSGAIVGGPVGAAVGAGVGAVAGGIADDTRPRFRSYVTERKVPSYRYDREVVLGADLPSSGVTYYEVPREYGVTKYRYTVVNDRTVLVDPGSHRIVQIIE